MSVAVSDGELTTTQSFSVTVTNGDTTTPPTGDWDTSVAYVGGYVVTYNGVEYKAKWWTQGNEPGSTDVWLAL